MFYDHQEFAARYERSFDKLTPSQFQGLDQLLGFIQIDPNIDDDRWVAYMLATVKHECADSFLPIVERGPESYFAKYEPGTSRGIALGNTQTGDGVLYKGRGYVQLTGRGNYLKLGQALGIGNALANSPAKTLEPATAFRIMSIGMREGLFTARKLTTYINDSGCDYVAARRVINGQDCASLIASYAVELELALRASRLD